MNGDAMVSRTSSQTLFASICSPEDCLPSRRSGVQRAFLLLGFFASAQDRPAGEEKQEKHFCARLLDASSFCARGLKPKLDGVVPFLLSTSGVSYKSSAIFYSKCWLGSL